MRGVSFTAYRGEAIGLIGSNGSGKSTLLRAIAGLLPPERGRVYTDGQPSLLGVNAALMNDLTGERNVILGGLAMGMSRERGAGALPGDRRLLRHQREGRLHLAADADLLLRHGGAAAVLDRRGEEPRRADDRRGAGHRRPRRSSGAREERIRELRKEAGTVFLVSHNNKSIRDTCDRVLWLEKGELLMDGPTDEVLARRTRRHAASDPAVLPRPAAPARITGGGRTCDPANSGDACEGL